MGADTISLLTPSPPPPLSPYRKSTTAEGDADDRRLEKARNSLQDEEVGEDVLHIIHLVFVFSGTQTEWYCRNHGFRCRKQMVKRIFFFP